MYAHVFIMSFQWGQTNNSIKHISYMHMYIVNKSCSIRKCDVTNDVLSGADLEEGAKGPLPPPNRWIIMLYNLFKVGKCIGLSMKDLFFYLYNK